MIGRVVVMEDIEYQNWLAGYNDEDSGPSRRKDCSLEYDCVNCHESGRRAACPTLGGLYGTDVPLADGRQASIRRGVHPRVDILIPRQKVVARL